MASVMLLCCSVALLFTMCFIISQKSFYNPQTIKFQSISPRSQQFLRHPQIIIFIATLLPMVLFSEVLIFQCIISSISPLLHQHIAITALCYFPDIVLNEAMHKISPIILERCCWKNIGPSLPDNCCFSCCIMYCCETCLLQCLNL